MRILVVGAGAVGGYFGARLMQAQRDVTFLVRPKRKDEIVAKGLQILSPYGDAVLHPKLVTAPEIDGPYDVILLGLKSYALPAAMNDFAAAVGPGTMIVPALNGMRHLDLLLERFGKSPVLGGVCLVATQVDDEGSIKQLAGFQSLIYGELDSPRTPRIENLHAALSGAGFDTVISDHIRKDMWQKWVQLATLGTVTCLLRGSIGEVAAVAGGTDIALAALRECSTIAEANGYPQLETFLQQQTTTLTTQGSPFTSSMYRDLMKGAPVEVDTILGDLLHLGEKQGLSTPFLKAAFVALSIHQNRLMKARP